MSTRMLKEHYREEERIEERRAMSDAYLEIGLIGDAIREWYCVEDLEIASGEALNNFARERISNCR